MTPRNPVRYAFGCPCCVQDGRRRGRSRLVTKRPDSGLNEINLKSGGKVEVDADTRRGTVLGKPGKVVRPRANSSSKVSINSSLARLCHRGFPSPGPDQSRRRSDGQRHLPFAAFFASYPDHEQGRRELARRDEK